MTRARARSTRADSQLALALEPARPARARRAKRAPVPPPTLLAWRCVTLAVDTARISGWAIRSHTGLLWSGELDTHDAGEIDEIVALALRCAGTAPLVLVLERAWGKRTSTLIGLGMARERWRAAWQRAEQSPGRIVSVYPVTWRAKVLGKQWASAKRDDVRPRELAAARSEARGQWSQIGPDEAAAILISRWAMHSPAVGMVLPKRVREQSVPLPPLAARKGTGR